MKQYEHLRFAREKAKIAGGRKLYKKATCGDPAVVKLSEILAEHAGYLPDVAKRAGIHRQQLVKWRRGYADPGLTKFRAVLNAVGYDLKVVKKASN